DSFTTGDKFKKDWKNDEVKKAPMSEARKRVEEVDTSCWTENQKKIWAALSDLVFVQNYTILTQKNIHEWLIENYGRSVNSNDIGPMVTQFQRASQLQIHDPNWRSRPYSNSK